MDRRARPVLLTLNLAQRHAGLSSSDVKNPRNAINAPRAVPGLVNKGLQATFPDQWGLINRV